MPRSPFHVFHFSCFISYCDSKFQQNKISISHAQNIKQRSYKKDASGLIKILMV
jgi:hypothetical protein